jgi:hypothetical protein
MGASIRANGRQATREAHGDGGDSGCAVLNAGISLPVALDESGRETGRWPAMPSDCRSPCQRPKACGAASVLDAPQPLRPPAAAVATLAWRCSSATAAARRCRRHAKGSCPLPKPRWLKRVLATAAAAARQRPAAGSGADRGGGGGGRLPLAQNVVGSDNAFSLGRQLALSRWGDNWTSSPPTSFCFCLLGYNSPSSTVTTRPALCALLLGNNSPSAELAAAQEAPCPLSRKTP